MRVQSGIGTSKPLNPKPHYFIISDSETDDSSNSCPPSATTPQNNPTSTSEKAPTHTKPTTPSKSAFSSKPSQSTPSHQKRRLIHEIVSPLTKQNEPSSQSKPQKKPMKTKSAMTIAQFLARKKLPNPQKRKTLAPKQNLKHCQPTSPEHSSQCSPPQPPERSPILERSPIQTPFSPPSQERSPNQEHSPAHSVSPLEPFPHTQPSSSTHANRSPTPERSSTSTSSESQPSPPPKKSKQNTPPLIPSSKTKLFKSKLAQRPVGIGRVFIFENLIIDGNVVQHHTNALGWTSFLQTSESYYPDVLPIEGPSVFGDNWYSALNLRKTEVLSDFFEEDSTRYLSTYLKPLPKVFNNMCQHTLIPHCGSHEYVSDNDALLIHHLLNCKRLNLPHVIIQHMICASTKDYKKNIVPYGMVLTKVFRYFGVSLSSKKSLINISKFSTKNLSHMRKKSSAQTPTPPSSFPISSKRKRFAGRRPTTHPIPFPPNPLNSEENPANNTTP
uniref:Proline-rich receptor-like protein kinase PERK10 n=1 Tax=Cicer arietinum TaxID=3827 RepID=A0A1S2XJS7_CICAR|nr:proline-rich receptor-like protein kinase PERK10 [Cicer arietinum]